MWSDLSSPADVGRISDVWKVHEGLRDWFVRFHWNYDMFDWQINVLILLRTTTINIHGTKFISGLRFHKVENGGIKVTEMKKKRNLDIQPWINLNFVLFHKACKEWRFNGKHLFPNVVSTSLLCMRWKSRLL